ncbi:hypothetical protein [Thermomonas paludicola]|uniref:hypothetical protein n=1 Tax=Thermomonas paludicola TaxID=2884874 RepID=UPI0021141FEB|nr:hypothetical protein [Thermomonas paludicola]
MAQQDALETQYLRAFGAVLSAAQTAQVLGYRSTAALAKARSRGQLPIKMFALPHRRGLFANTVDIAAWMTSQQSSVEG